MRAQEVRRQKIQQTETEGACRVGVSVCDMQVQSQAWGSLNDSDQALVPTEAS